MPEKVIKELNECIEHIRKNKFNKIPCWGNCQSAMRDALELLKEQEAVIRCKNCKYWYNGCCYSRVSNRINFTVEVPDDWFCADGERRTDDA